MRYKIIIPNLLAMLLIGLVSYVFLDGQLTKGADAMMAKRLEVVSNLFERSEALRGYEQLSAVRRASMSKAVTSVFAEMNLEQGPQESDKAFEQRIRQEWFKKAVRAVESTSAVWTQQGRKPALVFITDRNGVVLARNTTPNACPTGRNVAEAIEVVQRALDGEASYSVWSLANSPFGTKASGKGKMCSLMNAGMLEISAAPIWNTDDDVAGAIAVGFEVSNGTAAEKAKALGVELAVIHSGKVYSTSFTADTAREDLDKEIGQGEAASQLAGAIENGQSSSLFTLEVEGAPYVAVAAPVSNADKKDKIAYLFMGSVEKAHFFSKSLTVMLIIVLVGALLVTVIGFMLSSYFMRPIVAMEEGVLKIINGEFDYRFEVDSAEVGGLCYRINQMVNVFTEQDESAED